MIERNMERTRRIDAFSISIEELSGLCSRLQAEFEKKADVYTRIEVELPNERVVVTPDSIGELASLAPVHRVTQFTIALHEEEKHFRLSTSPISSAVAYASSNSEAWCAGINEAAVSYLRKRRAWHYWFQRWYVLWPAGLIVYFPLTYGINTVWDSIGAKLLTSGVMGLCLGVCLAFRDRVFPNGNRPTHSETFLHAYRVHCYWCDLGFNCGHSSAHTALPVTMSDGTVGTYAGCGFEKWLGGWDDDRWDG